MVGYRIPLIPTPLPRSRDPALGRRFAAVARLAVALSLVLAAGAPLSAQFDWTVVGEIPLAPHDPMNAHPYGLALHPDPTTRLAYVALAGLVAPFGEPPSLHSGRTVAEFRVDTLEVVRTFDVGYYPTELAVTADGAELYATTSTESTLFRISLPSGTVTALPLTDSLGAPVAYLSGVEISPDGAQVWVASNGGSFDGSSENLLVVDRGSGAVVDRRTIAGGLGRFAVRADGRVVLPVGFPDDDFTAAPVIHVYDTAPWTLVAALPVPVDTSDFPSPSDIVLSPDGTRAYVTIFGGSADVIVVDVDAAQLLPPLALGGTDFVQSAIALAPDGATLLVADFFGGRVRRLDRTSGAPLGETAGFSLPNALLVAPGRLFVTEQGLERVAVIALPGAFRRGDSNRDGAVDLADGIQILQFLFGGGALLCEDAADVDDGGAIDLGDAITVFSYLFQGGAAPADPFPEAGADPTGADPFGCAP